MKIGRCLPADFIKLPRSPPLHQALAMEGSKTEEFRTISRTVISTSSALNSVGMQRGSLWTTETQA